MDYFKRLANWIKHPAYVGSPLQWAAGLVLIVLIGLLWQRVTILLAPE